MNNTDKTKTLDDLLDERKSCDITPIDYKHEFELLEASLLNFKHLKPMLYRRLNHTGVLYQFLQSNLHKKTNSSEYDEHYDYTLAAYYANFGFVAIESSIYKSSYVTEKDYDIIKRHVYITANLMHEKKLYKVEDLVRRHHEKPNGSGYLKDQNRDKRLALINIADVFIDSILPSKKPEVALMLEEAVRFSLKDYDTGIMFEPDEVSVIAATLIDYYAKQIN